MDFDGSNTMYVDLGNPSIYNTISSQMTIFGRVRIDQYRSYNNVLNKGNIVAGASDSTFGINASSDSVGLRFMFMQADGNRTDIRSASGAYKPTDDMIFCARYNKGVYANAKMWYGGAEYTLNAVNAYTADLKASSENIFISKQSATYGAADCNWSYLMMFNRAISDAEMYTLKNSDGNMAIDGTGLLSYFRFNEKPAGQAATDANSIIDLSPFGNHGTPAGNPLYNASPMKLFA